jgi:predicted lipid-binding transport protein (Tim44 family)
MDPVTLIFLVVAIVVGLKLRSVLGQSDDDDDKRPMDGYGPRKDKDPRSEREQGGSDNVVTLPTRRPSGDLGQQQVPETQEIKKTVNMSDQISKYAKKGSALEEGLQKLAKADRNFEPESFLSGAQTAYEMIVMAFAEGNRKLLKQLLAKEVFEGFVGALDAREKKDLIVDSSFIGIDAAEFISAELRDGRTARVTVKFVSSLITATHNRAGDVIEGDPKKVREVTDIWTFARDSNSRDPNWQLVATESAS